MAKLRLLFLLAVCGLFTSCASHIDAEGENRPKQTVPIADLLKQADDLFSQRADLAKLREAVKTVARARNPDNRNFEVEWKYAKFNYFLGKQTKDEAEGDKILRDGYTSGLIASRIQPDKADGYFWAAANLGEQARRSPVTVGLKSTGEIRQLMSKVIEIQPNYQGASAFDGLAQLELATRMTGGKPEKAVELLQTALTHEKGNSFIHLHLAEAFIALQKRTEAKLELEHILKMKVDPAYELEYKEAQERARQMLETKF